MPDDLIVGDRISFGSQVRIPNVSNLRCSWEISRIGLLSCDIPERDLLALFASQPVSSWWRGKSPKHLLRKWVKWTHPTAGTWGGVITSVSGENGIISIDAQSWAAMFQDVLIWGLKPAGILANLQAAIVAAEKHTGIKWGGVAGLEGSPDDYTFADFQADAAFFADGQKLHDFLEAVMQRLYAQYGWASGLRRLDWHIDPDTRVFRIDPTYGRNLIQTVAIRDRVHVVSSAWTDDAEDVFNYVHLWASYNA
jgi:hypothetical protein